MENPKCQNTRLDPTSVPFAETTELVCLACQQRPREAPPGGVNGPHDLVPRRRLRDVKLKTNYARVESQSRRLRHLSNFRFASWPDNVCCIYTTLLTKVYCIVT